MSQPNNKKEQIKAPAVELKEATKKYIVKAPATVAGSLRLSDKLVIMSGETVALTKDQYETIKASSTWSISEYEPKKEEATK